MVTDVLVRGQGAPVTVFAHGLGGGIADTRPLGGGVVGTKVFYTARAHDGVPVDRFDYTTLAADLRAVADAHGATRALGVSMGAGALCRLLAATPRRFERVVLYLPALLDEPRGRPAAGRLARLNAAVDAQDLAEVTAILAAELPAEVRDTPAGRGYAAARAKTLCLPSMRGVPAALAGQVAVDDAGVLSRVECPALVLGCRGDPAHPAEIAERLAELLPDARLHVFDRPDVVWTRRAELRKRIGEFLSSTASLFLSPMRDFANGVRHLGRGFRLWANRPRIMLLGALPALIAAALLLGALIALAVEISDLSGLATWFADDWSDGWRTAIQVLVGVAIYGLALWLSVVVFTALTLLIGEPFYETIAEHVDAEYGAPAREQPKEGFWSGMGADIREALGLVLRSIAYGAALLAVGCVPFVGTFASAVIGAFVGGWFLAVELSGFAFHRRGLRYGQYRRLLSRRRGLMWGFGVPVFLLTLIPFAAIVTMPAAVAGATLLTRDVLGERV